MRPEPESASSAESAALKQELERVSEELAHWRALAVGGWAEAVEAASARIIVDQDEQLRAELIGMQNSLSWRVTRPLRALRSLINRVRGR